MPVAQVRQSTGRLADWLTVGRAAGVAVSAVSPHRPSTWLSGVARIDIRRRQGDICLPVARVCHQLSH
ncbi:hypothetical protein [Accumulibacter sp.]|uniref:hypothetical protein n=1 Tax=Accumulibacter sp. TaxID=2053492 RepID=UPI0026193719|nr:hypothetical protein [Accumulibacter sp.]